MRPTFNEQFMNITHIVAARATCDRAHVGCVLVVNNRIIATGYNGSVMGMAHCDDAGHLMIDGHCCRTIHAERNALADCARRGVATGGAHCYLTHSPCLACAMLMIQAGIVEFHVAEMYGDEAVNVQDFVLHAGVAWFQYNEAADRNGPSSS